MQVRHEGRTRYSVEDLKKSPHTLMLECPHGLPTGTQVRLVIGGFRTLCGGLKEAAWSLDAAETSGGGKVTVTQNNLGDFYAQMRGQIPDRLQQHVAVVAKIERPVPPGGAVVLRIKGRPSPYDTAPVFGLLQLEVAPPGKKRFSQIGRSVLLELAPGKPAQVEVRSKSMADTSGFVPVSVFMKDRFGNPTSPPKGMVRLEAVGPLEGLPAELDWKTARDGCLHILGVRLKGSKPARIRVRDEATGTAMLSAAILPGPIHGRGHFFGELHFHSEYSADGNRPATAAYAYGRDFLQLDVLALSEHAGGPWWPQVLAINETFHRPGRLVTIPAWELSQKGGHVNVYLRSPKVDVSWTDRNHDWAQVREFDGPKDILLIPHCTMAQGHPDFPWTNVGSRVRLVEMLQTRGCSETAQEDKQWGINPRKLTTQPAKPNTAGDPHGIYSDSTNQDCSVRAALAAGYRLGFVGGSDNHDSYPTRHAFFGLYATQCPPYRKKSNMAGYAAMTGFAAKELTREAIWQAMNGRHVYATSGVPIICHVEINEALMGSEIIVPRGEPVRLDARLHGTAPIERVEIISDGKTVKSWQHGKLDVELKETLPGPKGKQTYYYLRLLQSDGHRAWASPVWVTVDSR
ncbi:MAG: DUF3604 domain-containing protein [Pirellulales bacterium]|nr:DUF3604 domain-containing protein [Pirellulales bacterium]